MPELKASSKLTSRAKFYARIISILFANQNVGKATLKDAARGSRHLSLGIKLHNPLDLDKALSLSENIALSANCEAVISQRSNGLVIYQFQLAQGFWQDYTRQDLPASEAIGLAEKLKPVCFTVEDAPHALVAGTTGSGKSETVKSILIGQMALYSPDQLGIALIDPHRDYTDFHNASHLIAPIAHEHGDITQLLKHLVTSELKPRKENNIKSGKRLLVVIDEAHEVLGDSENLSLVQMLAQGRKFNIHLIVSTQKPSHKDLPKVLDNLDNRFVGKVTDGRLSAMVTGQAGLEAHKLTGKGDFLHVVGANAERFQVAIATRQDFDRLERSEVSQVEPVEQNEIIDLPVESVVSQVGRPKLELNPEYVAWYMFHYPDKVSRTAAKDMANITRDNHELHAPFVAKVIESYLALQSKRLQLGTGQ